MKWHVVSGGESDVKQPIKLIDCSDKYAHQKRIAYLLPKIK